MYWASVVLTSARVTLASALLMVIWPLPLKSPPRVVSMLRSAYLSRCMSWMYQVSATVLPLQLAFLGRLIDAAVLRAEGGGRLLAGEGVRDAGAVAPCAVLREQHARAERTVWEHGTGHGHEAVVLDAAVAEGHVLGVELQAVEARGGHDERVAMRAVGGPCAGLVLDGRDKRIAGVVDAPLTSHTRNAGSER